MTNAFLAALLTTAAEHRQADCQAIGRQSSTHGALSWPIFPRRCIPSCVATSKTCGKARRSAPN
jgi:hypothetical protein